MELTKPNVLSINLTESEKASIENTINIVKQLRDALLDNNFNCIEIDEWRKYVGPSHADLEYLHKEDLEYLAKLLSKLLVEDIIMKVEV